MRLFFEIRARERGKCGRLKVESLAKADLSRRIVSEGGWTEGRKRSRKSLISMKVSHISRPLFKFARARLRGAVTLSHAIELELDGDRTN